MKKAFIPIFILIAILVLSFSYFWQGIYQAKNPNDIGFKSFSVKKGEGGTEIAKNLEKEGLIKQALFFQVYVLISGKAKELKAGDYEISPSMNVPEIVYKIAGGEVATETITIIEGWDLRDIASYLEQRGLFQSEELFEITGYPLTDYSKKTDAPKPQDLSQEFDILKDKPQNVTLEGYLFPDTYKIKKGEKLENIVRLMIKNLDEKLTPELKAEIKKQGKSYFEIITMASLIEREVMTVKDKELVSGLLWKRLKAGMPLQLCSTVNYITNKNNANISILETQIDSPYNTYKYKGLPLGPIASPGLESIKAALYPKSSDYWFYLSTPQGQTIFSKTYKEHQAAQDKYLNNN